MFGHPARPPRCALEFFGDTVESIREFDPETQLSTTQLKQIEIAPMRELAVTASDFSAWADAARERWADPASRAPYVITRRSLTKVRRLLAGSG